MSGPVTPPTKRPIAAYTACLIALLLLGFAVVAVRDLAVTLGWTTGKAWMPAAVTALDGLTATALVVAVGIACIVIGVLLLWFVLRPATRTHQRAGVEGADVWISTGAVSTIAREAADRTPGVAAAESRTRKRKIDLTITPADRENTALAATVTEQVRTQLAGLDDRKINVKIRQDRT